MPHRLSWGVKPACLLSMLALAIASPAAGQGLVETGWEPDEEHPYRIPDAEPAEPIADDQAQPLRETFEELTEDIEGASWIVAAPHEDGVRDVFIAGEPGERSAKLGRVTSMLIGLAAASLVEEGTLDLDEQIYVYHEALKSELQKVGRAPTTNELMCGLGGVRVSGPSAYDRPLFNQEVAGLFERRPGRRLVPSEAGPAVVAWLIGILDEGTARQALGARLEKIGLKDVRVPNGGQLSATPRGLAEGLATLLSDEPGLDPKVLAEMGTPRRGTFEIGLGFTVERVEHRFGWVWTIQDPEHGLAVMIDHDRKIVSVLHAPGAEDLAELAEDLTARFEILVPAPREALDNVARFNARINAREQLTRLDKNKDGRLSIAEEADPVAIQGFMRFDQNVNGYLTLNEMVRGAGQPDYR